MASLYRRRKIYWIKYRRGGVTVRKSLETTSHRAAQLRKTEMEVALKNGSHFEPTKTSLLPFLEEYAEFLASIKNGKSLKNDFSCLRTIFGPVCNALKVKDSRGNPLPDSYLAAARSTLASNSQRVASLTRPKPSQPLPFCVVAREVNTWPFRLMEEGGWETIRVALICPGHGAH